MYLRRCYRNKDGKRHGYWALVESCRSSRGPRQRVVAYLSAAFCYVFHFLLFSALNFAHRAFDAFEIFALAAADITRFLT